MILEKKIKAGALQFVLFVGAVVAVLLMSFLLLTHTHKHFNNKTAVLMTLLESVNYGLDASLHIDFDQHEDFILTRESDVPIAITVKREFWGVFEKRTVNATHNNRNHSKIALVGARDLGEIAALYVNDHQRPVILVGNSQISGNAYLPEQGLKTGNIYGNSYHREKLLYGRQLKSDSVLPNLSSELEDQIKRLTDSRFLPDGERIHQLTESGIKNSFESETKIYQDRFVRLENIEITGNIIIIAKHKIVVKSSAKLKDILLIAPEIVVENWVKGNFQAIATESIKVGKKTELMYPSALVLAKQEKNIYSDSNQQQNDYQAPDIYLDAYAYLAGAIIALDASTESKYTPLVSIDMNAKVLGEVYCTKNLELKGRINGMVSTDGFVALENGSIYQNHIYNGVINSERLTPKYAGLLLKSRASNKKVMKWLY